MERNQELPEQDWANLLSNAEANPDAADETLLNLQASLRTIGSLIDTKVSPSPFESEPGCSIAVDRIKALSIREANSAPSGAEEDVDADLRSIRDYEVLEQIGVGGMGAVFKARHSKLDKIVAIKVLLSRRLQDEQSLRRFQREMRTLGKLDHTHLVRALDAGEEDGLHYLVMEYVHGEDISKVSDRVGPLPIAEACELVRQAAIGVEAAHANGIIHRDIKPANLILEKRQNGSPVVKVLDMGLAQVCSVVESDGLTNTGQVMGTIDYMAPEQAGSESEVGTGVDLYSLGATLYKLVTGKVVFSGSSFRTPIQKIAALTSAPPLPASQLRQEIPPELSNLIGQLLEKDHKDRPQTASFLAQALEPFCAGADLSKLLELDEQSVGSERQTIVDSFNNLTEQCVEKASEKESDTQVTLKTPSKPHAAIAPARQRVLITRKVVAATVLCFLGIMILGVVFYLPSRNGTLRVEINDPDIKVMVDENNNLHFEDKSGSFSVKPGAHHLTITVGGRTFQTKDFAVQSASEKRLSVRLLGGTEIQVLDHKGNLIDKHVAKTKRTSSSVAEAIRVPPENQVQTPTDAKRRELLTEILSAGGQVTLLSDGMHKVVKYAKEIPKSRFSVTELSISGDAAYSASDLPKIMAFPEIMALNLTGPVSDKDLHALGKLPNLKELGLSNATIVDGFNEGPGFSGLQSLHLNRCNEVNQNLTLAGFDSLVGFSAYDSPVTSLAHFGDLPKLNAINLMATGISDSGVKFDKVPPALTSMYIEGCELTDKGLEHWSEIKTLRNLRLDKTKVTRSGVIELRKDLHRCEVEFLENDVRVHLRPGE